MNSDVLECVAPENGEVGKWKLIVGKSYLDQSNVPKCGIFINLNHTYLFVVLSANTPPLRDNRGD